MSWWVSMRMDGPVIDPLGAKEALVMAVEPLGIVREVRVEVHEPEQLVMDGAAPARPAAPPTAPRGGQAPSDHRTGRKKPYAPRQLEACANCAQYRALPGWDNAGQGFFGKCAATGKPVYKLLGGEGCRAWRRKA